MLLKFAALIGGAALAWSAVTVQPDRRVSFRCKAPGQASVQLQLLPSGRRIVMTRESSGTWNTIVSALPAGFHYYTYLLDGVAIPDPDHPSYTVAGRQISGVEIPAPGGALYDVKDVPHGDLHVHTFRSVALGTFPTVYVYTPPGYESLRAKRYPVLYLLSPPDEDGASWTRQGRLNFILDNLIAEHKARPIIVVTLDGRPVETFDKLLSQELVWNIDSSYRTLVDRNNRAIAGGPQALASALKHPDIFGSLAVIGAALNPKASQALDLLHLRHTWHETPPKPDWQTWRAIVRDVASRLFE